MEKVKAYTDINQSKKLAEILPLESADMVWCFNFEDNKYRDYPSVLSETYKLVVKNKGLEAFSEHVPIWSLSALINVLSFNLDVYTPILFYHGGWILQFVYYGHGDVCEVNADDPVDSCVEMIIKLHEMNLL